ncbi:uncharacterized protein LOC100211529 [Hydra vulgaris]|uniref:Uncharacterized protein LOC100211529 n=1 Tax=Hydra vulgaris TaxID=6087 RepID=A0ABM4CWN6_HYDVU
MAMHGGALHNEIFEGSLGDVKKADFTPGYDNNKNSIDMERLPNKEFYDKINAKREIPNGINLAPLKDPRSDIDAVNIPQQRQDNINLNITLPHTKTPENQRIDTQLQNPVPGQTREINPPTSIYGIENLTGKPYDQDMKLLPDMTSPRYLGLQSDSRPMADMQSPRYPGVHMNSPHHSSPDRETSRQNHRSENNAPWTSPVKPHNYRAVAPPTSPYIDNRDPNYSCSPRRYVPPFYNNGRNFGHPNDRNRYAAYPLGSPLMTTMGYPREPVDSRYNLHMGVVGFDDDKFKLSPPSMDDKHIWTKQEVELLLDLYEEHKIKLQDPRVRKTKVWEDIAKEIHDKLDSDVNGCQCNQKFRNMKADFQKVVEHNSRSGSFRKTCKYYERLEKLLTPMSETEKLKEEAESETTYYNSFNKLAQNATQNANGFYDATSRSTSSSESSEHHSYETETRSTPSSPEKRTLNQMEIGSNEASPPPPPKRTCIECGGMDKRELIDVLKEFLKEQRIREEQTISKINALHKEKIDTVVRFLDLFQELVKKV